MSRRNSFTSDHDMFRTSVNRFIAERIMPFHAQWEENGHVPRELWREAGAAGILCPNIPEEYGGG